MGERIINPLFNTYDKYREMNIINPYKFGSSVDLKTGLISVWELDETSGTTVYDSYSTNDGANVNATVNQTGKIGTSYSFNGTSSEINLDTYASNFAGLSNGSVSVWVKVNTGLQSVFSISDISENSQYTALYMGGNITGSYADESLGFLVVTPVTANDLWMFVRDGTDTYNDNAWHHIVAVVDGVDNTIYIDGVKKTITFTNGSTTTTKFTNQMTAADTMKIGSRHIKSGGVTYHNLWANGNIDQFGIWNKGLSSSEVSFLYNSGNGRAYSSW